MAPMARMSLVLGGAMFTAACTAPPEVVPATPPPASIGPTADPAPWPEPPAVSDEELEAPVAEAVGRLVAAGLTAPPDAEAVAAVAASGDARLAWILADLLRLAVTPDAEALLVDAFARLTGTDPRDPRFGANSWLAVSNLLIGWDLPAPPGYREHKAALLLQLDPGWEPFFTDPDSTIDWRVTTWGGVFIDGRPPGSAEPCVRACIPALDDPALTSAAEGDWYPDERIVFGIGLGGEAVALPKHIMEVHEMVNLTVGGRRLGVPYCTLCASAQAYLTDAVPGGIEPLVLRTSGLLSRSNKVMYDLGTGSAFHTFTGRAASGPLREVGFVLEPVTVAVSTWEEWRAAHPDTRIVARDGGIGRAYPDDPLCGRDAGGPIFPIGPADTRLPAQAAVVGVIDEAGMPIAFAAGPARAELAAGGSVGFGDVVLTEAGGGLLARTVDGAALVAHEAAWLAWSQFHPGTALWAPPSSRNALEDRAVEPDTGRAEPSEGCRELLDAPG